MSGEKAKEQAEVSDDGSSQLTELSVTSENQELVQKKLNEVNAELAQIDEEIRKEESRLARHSRERSEETSLLPDDASGLEGGRKIVRQTPIRKQERKRKSTEGTEERHDTSWPQSLTTSRGSSSRKKPRPRASRALICASGLNRVQREMLDSFENVSSVTKEVTHLVVGDSRRRTLKFLQAVAMGKWVVSIDWLQACYEANELVDESPFEMGASDKTAPAGPHLSRVQHADGNPGLFSGYRFILQGPFLEMDEETLRDLLLCCGATVSSPNEQENAARSLRLVRLGERGAHRKGSGTVDKTWVFDSISQYKVLDQEDYSF